MKLCEITYVGASKVDREAGIIRGVRILGKESRNGREYSPKAMQEAAKLYSGMEVNVNHPDRSKPNSERKIEDGFGWLEAVEIKTDGVYGDLHYLKEHPVAGLVAEAAERNPKRFGLSHNAEGKTARANGKTVVESVERVLSVDLVQNPATNSGLFESELPESNDNHDKSTGQFVSGSSGHSEVEHVHPHIHAHLSSQGFKKSRKYHGEYKHSSGHVINVSYGDQWSHHKRGSTARTNYGAGHESLKKHVSAILSGAYKQGERSVWEALKQHDPKLLKLLEDAALLPPEDMTPMGQDVAPEADPAAQVKGAIVALITAALDNESGDETTMLATIATIIAARQAVLDGLPAPTAPGDVAIDPNADPEAEANPDPNAPPDAAQDEPTDPSQAGSTDPADQTPADESSDNPFVKKKKGPPMAESKTPPADPAVKALLEAHSKELADIKAERDAAVLRDACRTLLESANRDTSDLRLKALAAVGETDRKALIESWPERAKPEARKPRPLFSAPLREQTEDSAPYSKELLTAALK